MRIQRSSFALAAFLAAVPAACSSVDRRAVDEIAPDAGETEVVAVAATSAALGQAFYDENQCASCHTGETADPFAAPSLQGLDASTLLAWMDGSAPHSGGTFAAVTTEDAENLAAYLASDG